MGGAKRWRAPARRWRSSIARKGLELLHQHAQFEDGGVSVEAGLMEMLMRMESGRFKVFNASERLVRGVSALPPQGRASAQGRRRPYVGHPLRNHDAAICGNDRAGVAAAVPVPRRGFMDVGMNAGA